MSDYMKDPAIQSLARAEETGWINPGLLPAGEALALLPLGEADVEDARARLERFAPFIMRAFPETAPSGGLIESPLTEIPAMLYRLRREYSSPVEGRLFLKRDGDLPISGSIKARGGIYEVLKHAETLALEHGFITENDCYDRLYSPKARSFFSDYAVQVSSTGNLGLSIGVMSAALGFRVTVHMSADAKQWKKELLRSRGVTVMEYAGDYSAAVTEGRKRSDEDPMSYFVDDENSKDLFLGYAVAGKRLASQLKANEITVDREHPLFVYIPCGVGGGPGGVAFGLKLVFGDDVHVFFVEPVQAPCMLLGMASGLQNKICVQDIGLTGKTHADGLAVGRASGFVGKLMEHLLSGEFTISDAKLYDYMRSLVESSAVFAEPSACAPFEGVRALSATPEGKSYIEAHGLAPYMRNAVHIPWATGGGLVPETVREEYAKTRL